MKRIKIILSYLFGLLLSICLLILALLLIINKTALSRSFINRIIDENNYYENIYTTIKDNISDYMISSGFEEEIMDNVIVKEEVKKDIDNYIDNVYKGKVYKVDTTKIEERLNKNINDYLSKHNLGVDNTNELELFTRDISNIYSDEITLYKIADGFIPKVKSLTNILSIIMKVVCVSVIVLSIIVLILREVNIGSCILSSGLMIILTRLFIFERIDTENILIASTYFSSMIKSLFNYISSYMLNIGAFLIILGLLLSLFKNKSKSIEK